MEGFRGKKKNKTLGLRLRDERRRKIVGIQTFITYTSALRVVDGHCASSRNCSVV